MSNKINLTVTDTNGSTRSISIAVNPRDNLMLVLKEHHFDVPGACGGMASCGTCHIAVLAGHVPNPRNEDEDFMIDGLSNAEEGSRLACQIPVSAELDGLELKVLGEG